MHGTSDRWLLGRRPALDGVRGIAILLVLFHHVTLPGLPALGPVGVTVFFTLSGFLITGILVEEYDCRRRVSMRRFYSRRARRLLPALLVSTAVVAAFGPLVGSWWFEWRDVPPVLLYFSNWWALDHGGLPALGAFTGTWSLAVEEQFYVLWPLALLLVLRSGRRAVLMTATLGVVLSLAVRTYLLHSGTTLERLYLGTDTVAVALLGGAALVAFQGMRASRLDGRWVAAMGGLLVLATTRLDLEIAVPLGTLGAVIGAMLLLAGATAVRPLAVLESRMLVWFGQRSYGLYLWHGPLTFLVREAGWSWPAIVAVVLPTSLILAEASHRWVETPWRHPHHRVVGRHAGHARSRPIAELGLQRATD